MTLFILLMILFFILLMFSGKKQQKKIFQVSNSITPEHLIYSSADDNVIDVSDQRFPIQNFQTGLVKYDGTIPVWPHRYIYSYDEIIYANDEQKTFYELFRYKFLKGQFIDIQGNSNYVFILLFHLLNDYDGHKNLVKIKSQLQDIVKYYPVTARYAFTFLSRKLSQSGAVAEALEVNAMGFEQSYNYEANYWGLGTKYKAKLNLTEEDVKILNRIGYYDNVFFDIEFCKIEILRLFIRIIHQLEIDFSKEGIKQESIFNEVADLILKKHYKFRQDSWNYRNTLDAAKADIFLIIMKVSENVIREQFGHKRKVNTENFDNQQLKDFLREKLLNRIDRIIPLFIPQILVPDEPTERELYAQNVTRWKLRFDQLTAKIDVIGSNGFIDEIVKLGELNKRNPSVENIFFEASKFIAKKDKTAALILYVHYLYHDLKSSTFDNKQLTKTIQKSLFSSNEQLHSFEEIVSSLIKNHDLNAAVEMVSNFYTPKRKKIELNRSVIEEVKEKHSDTIELLNEYLKDEFENEEIVIKGREINDTELELEIADKQKVIPASLYRTDLQFTYAQILLLNLFAKNNFELPVSDVEDFSKINNVFRNSLIESVNDLCYELLDDLLIEEEDDIYIIQSNYYDRILAL